MTFLEVRDAGREALKAQIKEGVDSVVHQAYDLLKSIEKVSTSRMAPSNLPDLEIVMNQFQTAESQKGKQSTAKGPKDDNLFDAAPADSPEGRTIEADRKPPEILLLCQVKDSHYEQYITRDNNGRVLHGKNSVPKLEYDQDGKLTRVTTMEGSALGSFLTGAEMFDPIIYKRRADGKWTDEKGIAVYDMDFEVDQLTGKVTERLPGVALHFNADGTNYETDASGQRLLRVDYGKDDRSFVYDSEGRLTKVHYNHDRTNPFGQHFSDTWKRQEDGTWMNFDKDGKATGRRLQDIQCMPDGTYIETDFPCRATVFRVTPSLK